MTRMNIVRRRAVFFEVGWFSRRPLPLILLPYVLFPPRLSMREKSRRCLTIAHDGKAQSSLHAGARHSAVFGAPRFRDLHLAQAVGGSRGRWWGCAASFVTSLHPVRKSHNAHRRGAHVFISCLIASPSHSGEGGALVAIAGCLWYRVRHQVQLLPIVAALVAAHFLDGSSAWNRWYRLPVGLLAVAVGFFTGYPYAILNWPPFLEHRGRMGAYAGTREFDPVARFNYIAAYSAESGFGFLFTIVLGMALLYYIHRRRSEELLAATVIVASVVMLARTAHPFYARYLLPILPAAALIVGSFLMRPAAWLSRTRAERAGCSRMPCRSRGAARLAAA